MSADSLIAEFRAMSEAELQRRFCGDGIGGFNQPAGEGDNFYFLLTRKD